MSYYQRNKERIKKQQKSWKLKNPFRVWAILSRRSHRINGHIVEISNSELEKIAKNTPFCHYCGCNLDYAPYKGRRFDTPSLDRINNEKTINMDTVQIICKRCNYTKADRTHDEFIDYCYYITREFGG